jgi:hypothetical protein
MDVTGEEDIPFELNILSAIPARTATPYGGV